MHQANKVTPQFPLGQVVGTPAALAVLARVQIDVRTLLDRHHSGDWGDMCRTDKRENDYAVSHGSRIFSAYNVSDDESVWIITESDRSSTTVLLPDDY